MQVTGTIQDFCFKCYSCSSLRVYSTQAPGGPIVQRCENCHKLWHACAVTKRIVIPSPRTPTYITCECVSRVGKLYGKHNTKPIDEVQMYEKQLAQLLDGGDNPDTYAEEDYRIRKQMADHMEKRSNPKLRKDPKEGDVALEDYRLNEADKYRRAAFADLARARIQKQHEEAWNDRVAIQKAELDAAIDAEYDAKVQSLLDAQRRPLPSVGSLIFDDDGLSGHKNGAKTPKEAGMYRNVDVRDQPAKYLGDVRPLVIAAQPPGFDALSQFRDNEAKEHRTNVESGLWCIAALCDPEVAVPSNTVKTNLGRPGPGPFPMGAR